MPFPCFWRRSSSYNVRHDFNEDNVPKSYSFAKTGVTKNEELKNRRITVLRPKYKSEDGVPKSLFEDVPIAIDENPLEESTNKTVEQTKIYIPSKEDQIKTSEVYGNLSNEDRSSNAILLLEDQSDEISKTVIQTKEGKPKTFEVLKTYDETISKFENVEDQNIMGVDKSKTSNVKDTHEETTRNFENVESENNTGKQEVLEDKLKHETSVTISNSENAEDYRTIVQEKTKSSNILETNDETTRHFENIYGENNNGKQEDATNSKNFEKEVENKTAETRNFEKESTIEEEKAETYDKITKMFENVEEENNIEIQEIETNSKNIEKELKNKPSVTIIIEPAESEDVKENEQIRNQNESNFLNSLEVITKLSPSSSVENLEIDQAKTGELLSSPDRSSIDSTLSDRKSTEGSREESRRRSGVFPTPVRFDQDVAKVVVKYPKTESDEKFIKDAICKNEFLSKVITGRRLQEVVDAMYFKEIKAKEKIIKEGTRGGHMYVAAAGEFEVTKKGKGVVNIMKPGDVFGELAILYNAKRFASVKSITPSKVWVIDGTVYQQLVKKNNDEEQEEIVSFLQNVPILNEAGLDVLKTVAGLLKPEFFETGTTIVKEGDKGDKFYIITAGSVTVTTESNGFMSQLHKGNCFGEKALLEPVTRQATITADDPGTDCLTLTQKHFVDNFGRIEDISKITMISQPQIPISDVKNIVNEYSHLDLSEFKILKTLGVGGFGRVEFIQHKKDPSLTFALKLLKKYEMVQQEQQFHVINEMQIQMTCNSPFIIRLYKTFKDNKYIYFLMEVCLGGDLWSLLQRQPNKNFTEKGARFIAGCVLEALAYLHNQGFVYRDLKPENLLIDNNGYIKMTDFGFAKSLTSGVKSGTFAGTPEYLAPEIILNRGHDKAVDLWAYGIFIYELLNGRTPFRSNDPSYMKTYNNILSGLDIVIFPAHNSQKAKSLITKLLKKAPSERLGIEDIRAHKWYAEFDWEKLRACKITSPFRPKLSSNIDCRYIDHFRRDNDIPPDENSWWDEYF